MSEWCGESAWGIPCNAHPDFVGWVVAYTGGNRPPPVGKLTRSTDHAGQSDHAVENSVPNKNI